MNYFHFNRDVIVREDISQCSQYINFFSKNDSGQGKRIALFFREAIYTAIYAFFKALNKLVTPSINYLIIVDL